MDILGINNIYLNTHSNYKMCQCNGYQSNFKHYSGVSGHCKKIIERYLNENWNTFVPSITKRCEIMLIRAMYYIKFLSILGLFQ